MSISFRLPMISAALVLTAAVSAPAQSILSYDFESSGQWSGNFRSTSGGVTGTAAQTTVSGTGLFRYDVTGGNQATAFVFDQTPADTSGATDSTFATGGTITVSYDIRAATTNSSFSVAFADPANPANNVLAIVNINTGADQVRFFRDTALATGGVAIGTQVGTSAAPSVVEPAGAFTTVTVSLTVSGTTPTLSVTWGGVTTTQAFSAGDFNFANSKALVAFRFFDPGTGASPLDVDNIVITSPSAPDNPPGPPEDNVAPTLPAQTNRSVAALDTLLVTNTGSDSNNPPQTLTYQLTTAPSGATISANGVISWTPTPAQVSETPYTFTTVVTDSGSPALSATNTFEVIVTDAPVFEYSQALDFTNAGDFAGNFRTLTNIGGGTLNAAAGNFVLDARSNGGNTNAVLLYDTTPGDTTNATQTAFPTDKQVRVSFLARAATTGSVFTVSFADPRNANNRVSTSFIIRTGDDTIRFHRDGSLTSTSSSEGTQVGTDVNFDAGAEPASGAFVPVTAILTVSGTTPTITVAAGSGTPVTSAFVAGDIDWNPTLVLLRFSDPSANIGPLEIDNLLVAGGTPVIPAPPTLPPAPGPDGNLITVNPSFETGSLNNFSGSYSFTGWTGTNALFAFHGFNTGSVAAGTTTNGTRVLRQSWGGTLTTAVTARQPATPGTTYELTYDQRSLVRNFPNEKLGSTPTIEFFDEVGVRIKSAWNFSGRYRVQDTGINTWETFTVRAVAPPGAAYVGLFFNNPSGRFASNEQNYTQDRHVEMDNIRLTVVADPVDRLAHRRAPRLVEPGKTAGLKINHVALAARTLRVALVDSAGSERASSAVPVPAGRYRATPVSVSIPTGLPNGTYSWKLELLPMNGGPAVATLTVPNVLVDETVSAPTLNATDFRADHPNIQYQGRIEELPNGSRWWHWYGSEIRLRFSGTSLRVLGVVSDNGFGGYDANNFVAVINEDFANPIRVTGPLNGNAFVLPIVTDLPDGVHTARLYKANESNLRIRFDAFRVDAGRGLLRPEPISPRRIEVYGDSVTNASSAAQPFLGYSILLGRELDADLRNIAKGGTGVAASFSGQALLVNYYNNLSFPNVFNANSGSKYDLSQWIPDVVFCAFGHNDQFNGGAGTNFNTRYAEFKDNIRAAYPNAQVITANTLISNSLSHFQNAVDPLMAVDPKHVFVYQPNTWNDSATAHPPTDGHIAMVYGDERRASFADIVEDRAGWGLETPLTDYEQWAATGYTKPEKVAGSHAPKADPKGEGAPNAVRYGLGLDPATPVPPSALPQTGTDAGSGRLTLTFTRARAEATYVVEGSSDLVNWSPIATNPGSVGQAVTVTDSVDPGSRRFLRLRVNVP